MNGVTNQDGETSPTSKEGSAEVTSNSESPKTETTRPMDGVTETSETEITRTIDGVSENTVDTIPSPDVDVAKMDGVTSDNTNMSLPTKENINGKDNSGETSKLAGVTTQYEQSRTVSTSANTKKAPTLEEMVTNAEFPEKRTLLDGVTDQSTQSMASEQQLPDLITRKDCMDKTNKTPTERLLEAYTTHTVNDSEDIEGSIPIRDCPTTEDEDDAIDGLLALSNSSPKTAPKSTTQPEPSKEAQRKTPVNVPKTRPKKKKAGNYMKTRLDDSKNLKKKRSKKSKTNKETKAVAEKLGKQLQDMNLNERSSRIQNKEKATDGSGSTRKNKRPRREDSSDSPGSPPGVFTVTHHTLRRKETKDKNYRCGQCTLKAKSMEELKRHYVKKHKKVICSICNKTFDSDILLARHNYTHYDKRYHCKKCKEGFYFKSELKKHKVSHAKTPSFQCMVAGCGKWFKRVAEVNVHMEIHKKKKLEL